MPAAKALAARQVGGAVPSKGKCRARNDSGGQIDTQRGWKLLRAANAELRARGCDRGATQEGMGADGGAVELFPACQPAENPEYDIADTQNLALRRELPPTR